jgi:uncharacterized integral membrane protein
VVHAIKKMNAMNFKLVTGAVVLLAALVFSIQNAGAVDVKFIAWTFSTCYGVYYYGWVLLGSIYLFISDLGL